MYETGGLERLPDDGATSDPQPLARLARAVSAAQLVYVYDMDLNRNVYVNDAVFSLLGHTPEDVYQLRDGLFPCLLHPDDLARLPEMRRDTWNLGDGEVRADEVRLRHANGSWRRLAVREVVFTRNQDGTVCRVLGIAQDVTDDRRVAERQRRLTDATVAVSSAESLADAARLAAEGAREVVGAASVVVCYRPLLDAGPTAVTHDPPTDAPEAAARATALHDSGLLPALLSGGASGQWTAARREREDGWREVAGGLPEAWRVGAWLAAPLVARDGGPVGYVLAVHPDEAAFSPDDEANLAQFARVVALTLENRRLVAALEGANQSLAASEGRFRLATEAVNGHVYDWDVVTDTVERSEGMLRFLGIAPEAVRPDSAWWRERIHPDDRRRIEEAKESAGGEHLQEAEYRVRTEGRGYVWVYDRSTTIRDADGNPTRVVGYTVDVHARKMAESRARRVFDSDVVGVIYWNLDTSLITDANDRFLEMTGYSRADVEAGRLNFREMTPPEWTARNERGIRGIRARERGEAYEKEYFRRDGSRLPLIIGGALFEDSDSEGFSLIVDLSEQKRAEAALRESEGRFRSLAEAVPQFIWIADGAGRLEYANPLWTEYTGLTVAETGEASLTALIHPEDVTRASVGFTEAARDGGAFHVELRLRRRDGAYRWFQVRARPATDAAGRVTRWFGATTDIHDYKEAEERVANLNERLRRSMAESHHRIKNNLQVLSALSEIQTMTATATVPVSVVQRLGQQIRTLAALHDLLTLEYRFREDVSEFIALRPALTKLMDMMEAVSGGREIRWQCDDIRLPLKRTETFVLLLNELVQNAIKHGRGPVEVSVRADGESVSLAVGDDGDGFPPDFDPYKSANTGMELIEAMGRWDLQGEIAYENRPSGGARVTITFPLPPPDAAG
jgi:PAS domain S-box-containing protein